MTLSPFSTYDYTYIPSDLSYKVLVLSGQTRVYFIVPTKPLSHWPFRRQITERPEVSPEVILDGVAEESRFLNQVLQHPGFSEFYLTSWISLSMGCFSLPRWLCYGTGPYRIVASRMMCNLSLSAELLTCDIPHHSSPNSAISPFYTAILPTVRLTRIINSQGPEASSLSTIAQLTFIRVLNNLT